jgi:hypothetical protein
MTDADRKSTQNLLADWRAAGRDTVAARAAARVAGLALEAATAAEEAANEVEAAARGALDAVDKARSAALRAKAAAGQAAEAAQFLLEGAKGDKVRANHDVQVAEAAEGFARDAFHEVEEDAMDDAKREGYTES